MTTKRKRPGNDPWPCFFAIILHYPFPIPAMQSWPGNCLSSGSFCHFKNLLHFFIFRIITHIERPKLTASRP
nr:MAG TPA: hypothetical protein [Caudoviricetes sp.]